MENYKQLFLEVFPKKTLLVLNHNDVHRLNIMKNSENNDLMILDHEYAGLNLIGIDIVNYMIETNFNYTSKKFPFFTFASEEISFENYFEIFQQFLERFELSHQENFKNEEFRKQFKKINSYKYFLRLVCVISLFWILWGAIYLDFDKINEMKSFDYLSYAVNRIEIFQKAYGELKMLKTNRE